jgi:hypothetical protein
VGHGSNLFRIFSLAYAESSLNLSLSTQLLARRAAAVDHFRKSLRPDFLDVVRAANFESAAPLARRILLLVGMRYLMGD